MENLKIFIDLSDQVALERRIRRDTMERGRCRDSVIEQFRTTVQPANIQYILPSAANADIRLNGHEPIGQQIDLAFATDYTQNFTRRLNF